MSPFLYPDWPAPSRVRALVTTRGGGLSLGPYGTFNLGDHVGDAGQVVAANRARLVEAARLPAAPMWLRQVHGITCLRLNQADSPASPRTADSAVTDHPGLVCAVLTADCLPILLCDAAGSTVAAIHAGWRGLLDGVIESAVAAMGLPGERLLAWFGPAIGPAAFEVGSEVRDAFIAADAAAQSAFQPFRPGRDDGKWSCDLYALARQRLAAGGVGRVYGGNLCTFSDGERFFSYRRDGVCGRMASLVWLEPL